MLLEDAYRKYINEYAKKNYGHQEIGLHVFIMETWILFRREVDADRVTPELFMEWQRRLAEGRMRSPTNVEKYLKPHAITSIHKFHKAFMRAMRWMMLMQIVSTETHYRLAHVPCMRRHRGLAREPDPILPVPDEQLHRSIGASMSESFCDILMLIRLSGMRPGEAVSLCKEDIDKTTDPNLWIYAPKEHKTAWRGQGRVIVFGPKCQEIITKYENKKRLEKGPLFRNSRGNAWTVRALQDRLKMLCLRHGIPHWTPRQLRKTRANEVFQAFGTAGEAAALGHTPETARKHYLVRELKLAYEVALEIG